MKRYSAIIASLLPLAASAAVTLPNYITSNMVMQHDDILKVNGHATPGSKVTASPSWLSKEISAKADKEGNFSMQIPTPAPGGPFCITFTDGQETVIDNLLSGELWLCSGQSNMEFPIEGWTSVIDADRVVAEAHNPDIRLLQVRKNIAYSPQEDVQTNMGGWVEAASNTMDFSAIAYLFAKELRDELKMPVGVIDATWGGTPAEAWTGYEALKSVPGFEGELDALQRCGFDSSRLREDYEKKLNQWMSLAKSGGNAADPSKPIAGKSLPAGYFERVGFGNSFDGIMWVQKSIDVPEAMAGKDMTLYLGAIDDEDVTYLNGKEVARGSGYNTPRVYNVPGNLVKAGSNLLTIRISDFGGEGGFAGPVENMHAEIGGVSLPITGDWTYSVGVDFADLPQKPASVESSSYPTVLYNAMLYPLRNLPIQGVLWYQGCANVGRAEQYEPLFQSLINDWRGLWGKDFPFYFVQLAGWLKPQTVQPDSDWAALRNAQSKALSLPNTAMVSAIDLGNPADIHPRDKQSVAHRLALTALNRDYGRSDCDYQAPVCKDVKVEKGKVRLTFDRDIYPTSVAAIGFIIGDANGDFAQGMTEMPDRRTIVVSSPRIKNPDRVRYNWADYPNGNLYSSAGIPVAPFATDK
ncbi:MAG: 9-O-acetylesterase [Bacteroides sp.]|nr:9-O-acetylesterase [Bacteroides sp.]